MRIPLLRGRVFDDRDGANAVFVAIVNETMARTFWPSQDVIGKRFGFTAYGRTYWVRIVGVAGDLKQTGLNEPPREEMYFPYWQAEGTTCSPPRS